MEKHFERGRAFLREDFSPDSALFALATLAGVADVTTTSVFVLRSRTGSAARLSTRSTVARFSFSAFCDVTSSASLSSLESVEEELVSSLLELLDSALAFLQGIRSEKGRKYLLAYSSRQNNGLRSRVFIFNDTKSKEIIANQGNKDID